MVCLAGKQKRRETRSSAALVVSRLDRRVQTRFPIRPPAPGEPDRCCPVEPCYCLGCMSVVGLVGLIFLGLVVISTI